MFFENLIAKISGCCCVFIEVIEGPWRSTTEREGGVGNKEEGKNPTSKRKRTKERRKKRKREEGKNPTSKREREGKTGKKERGKKGRT